jgi:predicted cupin superfamily sugar epimerase
MDAKEIIGHLGLVPLAEEGGYYRETYRCDEKIVKDFLPPRYGGDRNCSTAIYYLLTPEMFSALHRVKSDEIFHFYAGDRVSILQLYPDGHGETVTLGNDLKAGQKPQCIVPRGVWQGCFVAEGGKFALMGTTVAPGFEFDDFELGKREELLRKFPRFEKEIIHLTRVQPAGWRIDFTII